MTSYIALYRGPTVKEAELIAISANQEIVRELVTRLLVDPDPDPHPDHTDTDNEKSPTGEAGLRRNPT